MKPTLKTWVSVEDGAVLFIHALHAVDAPDSAKRFGSRWVLLASDNPKVDTPIMPCPSDCGLWFETADTAGLQAHHMTDHTEDRRDIVNATRDALNFLSAVEYINASQLAQILANCEHFTGAQVETVRTLVEEYRNTQGRNSQ